MMSLLRVTHLAFTLAIIITMRYDAATLMPISPIDDVFDAATR